MALLRRNLHVLIQVPANRIGHRALSLARLKLDCLRAALCMTGAVYFIFRG